MIFKYLKITLIIYNLNLFEVKVSELLKKKMYLIGILSI